MDQQGFEWMNKLDSMDESSRNKLLSQVDQNRAALLGALLKQLGSSPSKNVQAAAIYLIGRNRLSDGVGELIRRIDFDAEAEPRKHAEPLWERYPAMEALVTIGLPSVQPSLQLLASERDDLRRDLAAKVIRYVEGSEVAKFILERAVTSETDAVRKANLADALRRLERLPR
jgi:hypothetical protein